MPLDDSHQQIFGYIYEGLLDVAVSEITCFETFL